MVLVTQSHTYETLKMRFSHRNAQLKLQAPKEFERNANGYKFYMHPSMGEIKPFKYYRVKMTIFGANFAVTAILNMEMSLNDCHTYPCYNLGVAEIK